MIGLTLLLVVTRQRVTAYLLKLMIVILCELLMALYQ